MAFGQATIHCDLKFITLCISMQQYEMMTQNTVQNSTKGHTWRE